MGQSGPPIHVCKNLHPLANTLGSAPQETGANIAPGSDGPSEPGAMFVPLVLICDGPRGTKLHIHDVAR